MEIHNAAPLRLILVVLAFVLFLLSAVLWPAPVEPYRNRLIGAGLACWVLSTFF